MIVLSVALTALIAALVVLLGFVPGRRSHASRVFLAVVAVLAGIVLAGAAVVASFGALADVSAPTPSLESSSASGGTASGGDVGSEPTASVPASGLGEDPAGLPRGFSHVRDYAPGIDVELRYATIDNFTGQVVDGYESTEAAILRTDAAKALAKVQGGLEAEGLGLRIYDAFRPTRAVSFFMDWAASSNDMTKVQYYPDFEKPELFELGYIAEKSGHSLGGTVDLTLIDLASGEPLDMGGPFDFFGELSHYETAGLTAEQTANRARLHDAMLAQGFSQYPLEWWHYSFPVPEGTIAENFVVR